MPGASPSCRRPVQSEVESGRGLPQSKTLRDVSGAGGPAGLGLRQPLGRYQGLGWVRFRRGPGDLFRSG